MSSPMFWPLLMPETIRSGRWSSRPVKRHVHAVARRAVDDGRAVRRLPDSERAVERQRVAGAAAVLLGRHDGDVAQRTHGRRQRGDAGRKVAVVVGNENAHRRNEVAGVLTHTGPVRWNSLVGAAGFELATPCTPCKCATRLRYAPKDAIISAPSYSPRRIFRIDSISSRIAATVERSQRACRCRSRARGRAASARSRRAGCARR